MNPTHLASLILLVKKITIVSVLFPTRRQMSSWFVSVSPHPPPSKTYARNGFPKFTTIALEFLASSSVPKPIFVTIRKSETS